MLTQHAMTRCEWFALSIIAQKEIFSTSVCESAGVLWQNVKSEELRLESE